MDPDNENSHYRRVAHVRQLMRALDIPQDRDSYGEEYYGIMQAYYDREFAGMYRIVVFDENPELKPIWKGPSKRKYEVPIYLTMNDQQEGHYDVSYQVDKDHRLSCIARCPRCCSIGPEYPCVSDGKDRKCNDCKRVFVTAQCFVNHQNNGCCRLYKFCESCHKPYKKEPEFPHVCGEERCRQCHVFHDPKRSCFITPLSFKKDQELYRMVFFDFECSQDKVWSNDVYQHVVNFVSVRIACRECKGNEEACLICGKRKHIKWSGVPTAQNPNPQPLNQFVDWLLNAFDKEFDTVIYAHYGGRYDHHFVLNRLYELGLRPSVIIGGCKIYEMTVKQPQMSKLIFRDSHLIMPVKLADLPKTFGLDTEAKMYFPHMYNKAENYGVRLRTFHLLRIMSRIR
ncbi:DNA polymerase type b, organellar and viral domain-containing protein [Ditylenchus destructor]|nr:DNA polymerase type b, organellar and viral domain-containing protein [Ditylenchus destructor]